MFLLLFGESSTSLSDTSSASLEVELLLPIPLLQISSTTGLRGLSLSAAHSEMAGLSLVAYDEILTWLGTNLIGVIRSSYKDNAEILYLGETMLHIL